MDPFFKSSPGQKYPDLYYQLFHAYWNHMIDDDEFRDKFKLISSDENVIELNLFVAKHTRGPHMFNGDLKAYCKGKFQNNPGMLKTIETCDWD